MATKFGTEFPRITPPSAGTAAGKSRKSGERPVTADNLEKLRQAAVKIKQTNASQHNASAAALEALNDIMQALNLRYGLAALTQLNGTLLDDILRYALNGSIEHQKQRADLTQIAIALAITQQSSGSKTSKSENTKKEQDKAALKMGGKMHDGQSGSANMTRDQLTAKANAMIAVLLAGIQSGKAGSS